MSKTARSNANVILKETLFWIVGWGIVTSLRAAQWGFSAMYQKLPVRWGLIWGETALDWGTCALLTLPYVLLVRRVARARLGTLTTTAIYTGAIVIGLFAKYAMYIPLENAIFHSNYSYWFGIVNDFYSVSMGNLATLAVIAAIEHSRVAQERQLRASRLEAQLSQAQLEALRSQLSPHFLFNTLNAIASLVRTDADAAEQMLIRLSEMLRMALDSDAQEVHLAAEADFLERYRDIMRMRFGKSLSINVDMSDDVLNERVPHFLLQPLVENSVRHGMDSGRSSIAITVSARTERDRLRLDVVDNGKGLSLDIPLREGIGIGHTRRRLEQMYGALASLTIANRPEGGTAVTVELPRRAAGNGR